MPVPSFEQQPAEEAEPAPEETPEPAAEQSASEAEPTASMETPEPVAEHSTEAEPAAPEEAPEPPAEQPAEDPRPSMHFVLVRLRDGESLRIGDHLSAAEASAQAADAVAQISSAASNGTWPLFAGRYLSPGTIVSVDLLEESPDA
jgi:hypothetical protein